MKKSYDYFKTLKDLSVIVSESFADMRDSKAINKNYLCFSAIRNELSEKLIDEFVNKSKIAYSKGEGRWNDKLLFST